MSWDLFFVLLLQSIRNPFFDLVSLFFAYTFSTIVLAVFAIVLLVILFWKKNPKAFLIPFSLAILTIIVKLIKELFSRTRPDYALSLPMLPYSQYSFPSGHTASAFLLAVILSKQYPKYAIMFYSTAVLVGLSRLYLGLHFLSDVLASIAIGSIIGLFCLRKEKQIISFGEKIIKFAGSFHKSWQH